MSYASFEKLEIWQRACRLAVAIYKALEKCRDYALKDQMTRASVSIASNIAEGAERETPKEFMRFLHIAKGSAAELRTQVYIACRIGVIDEKIKAEMVEELIDISRMTHGLIKHLKT